MRGEFRFGASRSSGDQNRFCIDDGRRHLI
jgi:hypothetical protein